MAQAVKPRKRVPVKARTRIVSTEPVIVQHLLLRQKYTPDFRDLKFFDRIPLFIYDDHQREGLCHFLLDGSEYLGKATTLTPFFKMFSTGRDPIVYKETEKDKVGGRGAIRGELYNVSVEGLHVMDRENRNGDRFHRVLEKVILEDQDPSIGLKRFRELPWIHSFMYIGNKTYWDKVGGLTSKPSRINRMPNNPLKDRPYFEWDAWEAGWGVDWAMTGSPYGNEFAAPGIGHNSYPPNGEYANYYQDRYGAWHKNDPGEDWRGRESHIG